MDRTTAHLGVVEESTARVVTLLMNTAAPTSERRSKRIRYVLSARGKERGSNALESEAKMPVFKQFTTIDGSIHAVDVANICEIHQTKWAPEGENMSTVRMASGFHFDVPYTVQEVINYINQ